MRIGPFEFIHSFLAWLDPVLNYTAPRPMPFGGSNVHKSTENRRLNILHRLFLGIKFKFRCHYISGFLISLVGASAYIFESGRQVIFCFHHISRYL